MTDQVLWSAREVNSFSFHYFAVLYLCGTGFSHGFATMTCEATQGLLSVVHGEIMLLPPRTFTVYYQLST
jgi:hypothetical protein